MTAPVTIEGLRPYDVLSVTQSAGTHRFVVARVTQARRAKTGRVVRQPFAEGWRLCYPGTPDERWNPATIRQRQLVARVGRLEGEERRRFEREVRIPADILELASVPPR